MMIKGGDKAISTIIRRTSKGLELTVRLHEAVEEFFRASAGEELTAVKQYGRKWTPLDLYVYALPEKLTGASTVSGAIVYRLDRPGHELSFVDPSTGLKTINMSFVRLVGGSAGEGVTFLLAGGAYEKDDVIWIGQQITEAGNIIYKKYISPMVISTNNIIREEVERTGDHVV